MLSGPNRPMEDLLIREGMQRQKQLDKVQPVTPEELQLTPSERSVSRRKYLFSLSLLVLSVLVVVALILFFFFR